LADDRRSRLVRSLQAFFDDNFDEPLSDFRANELLDFIVAELGPVVYNQGVQDTRGYVLEKLEDLEGEVYEPERPGR
jgi:uncharacterized protein (DUF2164 family)